MTCLYQQPPSSWYLTKKKENVEMDYLKAVDINISKSEAKIECIRRKDLHISKITENFAPKSIGLVAAQGLGYHDKVVNWIPHTRCKMMENSEIECVVCVFNRDNETIITTPFNEWGKAPEICLQKNPKLEDLGHAILTTMEYAYRKMSDISTES